MLSRLLIVAALAIALPALSQDYEIKLHRPERVGQKSKLSVTGRDTKLMSVWSNGKSMREQKREFSVDFEAVATVLEVSSKGKPRRVSLQVEKLQTTEGGIQKELLARNTVVIASNVNKKNAFEVNGKQVPPEVEQALSVVVSIGSSDRTDDELFGTTERKRVGDSWPVNGAALADMMADPKMTVKDVKGRMTLKSVLQDAAGPRLLVAFEVTGQSVPVDESAGLPDGTVTMKGTGEFPIDLNKARVMETAEMNFSARTKRKPNPNTAEMEIRLDAKRSNHVKITPIK